MLRPSTHLSLCLIPLLLGACASVPSSAGPAAPSAPAAPSTPQQAPTAVQATPAASLVDHLGDSTTTAVSVPADAPEEGVPFENNWIFDRFGRFRKVGGGTGQEAGRRYDVVRFELPDHSEHTVYFDITENWAHWAPPH